MTTTTIDSGFDAPPSAVPSSADVSRERPLPASLTVRAARDVYLTENGFTTDGYTAEKVSLMIFGGRMQVSFPNWPSRRAAVPLHDLHHVATGYGADWAGEGEIGIWELMGGCEAPIVYALNGTAALIGCFVAPGRMLQAYYDARKARALYRQNAKLDDLLDLTVGELRERLGIPRDGLARTPRAVAAKPRD